MKKKVIDSMFLALVVLLFVSGCEPDNFGNPDKLCEAPDGLCWDWNCTESGCAPSVPNDLHVSNLPVCDPESELFVGWGSGRLFNIATSCVSENDFGWEMIPSRARPVICDNDNDCPSFADLQYECMNGLCQNKDEIQYPRDIVDYSLAEDLCIASFPRAETVDWDYQEIEENIGNELQEVCPINYVDTWFTVCEQPLPDYCLDI